MNKILYKYLTLGFLKIVLNSLLIIFCFVFILNLFEEINFFKDINVGIGLPLLLTLMYIPNLLVQLLPFAIFLASMYYFFSLQSNNDLLSLKVFGFSNWKIVLIISTTALIFGLFILFAATPITSAMIKFYEKTKATYSKDIDHLVSINKNGVWIKEINSKNFRITKAKSLEGNFLNDLTIYEFNKNNKVQKRIESKTADISNKLWMLKEVKIYNFKNDLYNLEELSEYKIDSNFDESKINSLYKNLDTISFVSLVAEYDEYIKKGYTNKLLNKKLNDSLSLPIFLFLMVVLASIFTVGAIRKTQNTYYIFIAIISVVVIYFFKDLSIALAETNRISLILSIWMPIIAIGLFCSIGVIQINENKFKIFLIVCLFLQKTFLQTSWT